MEMHGIVGNEFPVTESIIIYVQTHISSKGYFSRLFFNITAKGKNSKKKTKSRFKAECT